MSYNVTISGNDYTGIDSVKLLITDNDGDYAEFINGNAMVGLLDGTLDSVRNDVVTTLRGSAIANCLATSISFPNVENCGAYAFQGMKRLKNVNLPKCKVLSTMTFQNCIALEEITLPLLVGYGGSTFSGCSLLNKVDFGSEDADVNNTMFTSFGVVANAFLNCAVLDTVVLRYTTMIKLSDVTAFKGTPFAEGGAGGKIYVPSSLIETYKTATNWSTLYGYGTVEFVAIEGSEYE